MKGVVKLTIAVVLLVVSGMFIGYIGTQAFKSGVFYGCLASVKLTEAGKPFEYQDIENLAIELREQK